MTTATALRIAREALDARRDLDSLTRALHVADESNLDRLLRERDEAQARYVAASAAAARASQALNA